MLRTMLGLADVLVDWTAPSPSFTARKQQRETLYNASHDDALTSRKSPPTVQHYMCMHCGKGGHAGKGARACILSLLKGFTSYIRSACTSYFVGSLF